MWSLITQAFWQWQEDNVSRLAAALAFYTLFSLAPTLIIVTAVSTVVVEESAAQSELAEYLHDYFGPTGAEVIIQTAAQANREFSGPLVMVLGFAALFFGATAVFSSLQDALNTVWNVKGRTGIKGFLYRRVLAFLMVLVIGLLLLVSVIVSTGLAWAGRTVEETFPQAGSAWHWVDTLVSFGAITLMFAMIFKFVPQASIRWRDVWVGAVVTALLFTFGKYLIALYLGGGGISTVYGAAGSLVVLLLWVYYSAQVFFFGAELTQVYARRYGSEIVSRPARRRPTVQERLSG